MKIKRTVLLALSSILALGTAAQAYINPNFTPKDLAKDSELILLLEFKSVEATGKAVATVKKVLKGDCKDKEVTFDLLAMPEPMQAQGKEIMGTIADGYREALLFAGHYQAEGTGMEGAATRSRGFCTTAPRGRSLAWATTIRGRLEKIERTNARHLLRQHGHALAVHQLRHDGPQRRGAGGREGRMGREGPDREDRSQDSTRRRRWIWPATGSWPRFWPRTPATNSIRWNGKTMENVTARLALKSKSSVFAWGDFNRDGKIDLASWDGKELSIHGQKADGTFAAAAVKAGEALKDGCLSLSLLDVGRNGRPGLLVGTKASPVILTFKDDGSAEGKPLVDGRLAGEGFGRGRTLPCRRLRRRFLPGRDPTLLQRRAVLQGQRRRDRSPRR